MAIAKTTAEHIASAACAATMNKEIEAERAEESRLAVLCYECCFDKEDRDRAAKMPTGWLRLDSFLRFNIGGWEVRLNIHPAVPVPNSTYGCPRLGAVVGDLADEVRSFIKKRDARKDERSKTLKNLVIAIIAARSFKKLAESWPEGKPHFEQYLNAKKAPGTALAVSFSDINKAIGLTAQAA